MHFPTSGLCTGINPSSSGLLYGVPHDKSLHNTHGLHWARTQCRQQPAPPPPAHITFFPSKFEGGLGGRGRPVSGCAISTVSMASRSAPRSTARKPGSTNYGGWGGVNHDERRSRTDPRVLILVNEQTEAKWSMGVRNDMLGSVDTVKGCSNALI